jgi:PAS domain S-box-containing protein
LEDRKVISQLAALRVASAVAASLFGVVALAGWITGSESLRGAWFEGITMKTNTSICVVLTALAILLLGPDRQNAFLGALGRAAAFLVLFLGLATLAQHVFGWDFGIDQLLFREAPGAVGTPSPNRMGVPASICFILLGTALLTLDRKIGRGQVPSQWLALGVLLLSMVSMLGYLFGAPQLYGIAGTTGIALQTAIAVLLLGAAVLLARPWAGFMERLVAKDSGALLVRRLLPGAILVPILLMVLRNLGENAGLYDLNFSRVLLVLSMIMVFTALVWATGGVVSRQEARSNRAQAELQGRLVHSLESMNDSFVACDSEWRITYMNAAAEKTTGVVRDSALGRAFWEVFPDALGTRIEQDFRRGMRERSPAQFELYYEPYSGWFEFDVFPTVDGGLVAYGRNITERKRALDALRDADRRKNQFLATLAHELRNPLAPVRNAVQLLRQKENTGREADLAHGIIDRQVDHLARLIEDLMDVSRISHNKLELRKERVTLSEVIAGAIESSRPLIEANRHKLSVTLPQEPLILDADTIRLSQVFMNLLTNAAKYTPPGGDIRLTATREGSDVLVRVVDNGIGLTPEQKPYLFEMFFQTQDVLQRTQGGLGIGLAIVRHLVELHGGSVTVRSDGPNEGSEFTVRLPLSADQSTARSPSTKAESSSPTLDGRRILVVDDNKDAALSLAGLLQLSGAEVHTAHDGEQALGLAAQMEFDVVILDIGLPEKNGYEVAREIRTLPWGPEAVLLALTGWGQAEDRALSKEAGFDHHLVKPVIPGDLLKILGRRTAASGESRG